MKKKLILILFATLFSAEHLQFSRVVVKPDKAELISIFNPTEESISLDGYYISDSPNYYKIQTDNNFPGHPINDFLAKFPSIDIAAGDSINLSIHPEYSDIYLDNFAPDLNLQFDLIETTAIVRQKTSHLKGLKIAIMGCIVNGPGEMADADYGYVGTGNELVSIYKGQNAIKKNISAKESIDVLINIIKENGDWIDPKEIQ